MTVVHLLPKPPADGQMPLRTNGTLTFEDEQLVRVRIPHDLTDHLGTGVRIQVQPVYFGPDRDGPERVE